MLCPERQTSEAVQKELEQKQREAQQAQALQAVVSHVMSKAKMGEGLSRTRTKVATQALGTAGTTASH
eukprot:COSAG06_NODE_15646_length_1055_cov_1.881799_2_plen_68_part_00